MAAPPASGLAQAARAAATRLTCPVGVAAAGLGGHGVAADCGEPWPAGACRMAETLADTFMHATEINCQLGEKKAELLRAEMMLRAASQELTEARGQASRAQSIAERFQSAA